MDEKLANELEKLNTELLVKRTIEGDNKAYEQLVKQYWSLSIALATAKLKDPVTSEDIAQESFIKAYVNLSKLRDPGRFAGWLSKIVYQQCSNHLRKKQKEKLERIIPLKLNDIATVCPNPGLTDAQIRFIRERIAKLPDKMKTVVVMRFVGGLSAAEIASQLGKGHSAVRTCLHRTYQKLKVELAPILEEVNEL